MSSIWFDSNIIIAAVGLREIIVACLNLFRSMIQRFYFTIIVTFSTIFLIIFITILFIFIMISSMIMMNKNQWFLNLAPHTQTLISFTFILAAHLSNNHFHFHPCCLRLKQSLSLSSSLFAPSTISFILSLLPTT